MRRDAWKKRQQAKRVAKRGAKSKGDVSASSGRRSRSKAGISCDTVCVEVTTKGDVGATCTKGFNTGDMLADTPLSFIKDDLKTHADADATVGAKMFIQPDGTVKVVAYVRAKGQVTIAGQKIISGGVSADFDVDVDAKGIVLDTVRVFSNPSPKNIGKAALKVGEVATDVVEGVALAVYEAEANVCFGDNTCLTVSPKTIVGPIVDVLECAFSILPFASCGGSHCTSSFYVAVCNCCILLAVAAIVLEF